MITVEVHDANGLVHVERPDQGSYPTVMQTVDVVKLDAQGGAMGELSAHPQVLVIHHADEEACKCDGLFIRCNILQTHPLD